MAPAKALDEDVVDVWCEVVEDRVERAVVSGREPPAVFRDTDCVSCARGAVAVGVFPLGVNVRLVCEVLDGRDAAAIPKSGRQCRHRGRFAGV